MVFLADFGVKGVPMFELWGQHWDIFLIYGDNLGNDWDKKRVMGTIICPNDESVGTLGCVLTTFCGIFV